MGEDYLWDGSGERDETVAKIERQLAPVRWSAKPLAYLPPQKPIRPSFVHWAIAAAALACVALYVTLVYWRAPTSWTVTVEGQAPTTLQRGQTIETTRSSSATVQSEDIGRVDLMPSTRLKITSAARNRGRFLLDRGTIHALIWAPPTKFVVDTPSAVAVDLGCQYTLSVAADGSGFLSVEMGWVAFEAHGIESFIPEGAACKTNRDRGPGTPYFQDAPPQLVDSLVQLEATNAVQFLPGVLQAARPRDALTLWHLLKRTGGKERSLVYDRLAQLVTLPTAASRDAISRGDSKAFDAAWNALQIGDTSWWREWKRAW